MTADNRKYKRVPAQLEVYWERETSLQLVKITDLSLGGCFIRTNSQPTVGTVIDLELRLPSGKWLSLDGMVVRCKPGEGFGVQFTQELRGDILALINPV